MSEAVESPLPTRHRWLSLTARFFALLTLVLFLGTISYNLTGGKNGNWRWGGLKLTDLSQHYAGGLMWKEGLRQDLYRDYRLGEWMVLWQKNTGTGDGAKAHMDRFNYVYCPLVAQISAWLTRFTFETWANSWFVLSLILYAASGWLLMRNDPGGNYCRALPLLWFAGFHSFYFALIPGQNTVITLFLLLCSGGLLNQKREWLAGLVMSCAFYKPQIMPILALFLLLAGHWRFAVALVLGNLVWLALGLLICGWPSHLHWLQSLQDMAQGRQFQKPGMNQGWTGFLQCLGLRLSLGHTSWIAAALSLATLTLSVLTLRKQRRNPDWLPAWTLYLAFTVWLLASPYVGHYELLLGLPWWMVLLVRFDWDLRHGLLLALFWLTGLISLAGLCLKFSFSAPFLALWLLGSLSQARVSLLQKESQKRN